MFNIEILKKAVEEISPEGREQLQKMIDAFEDLKKESKKLEEIAEAYEALNKKLITDKEHLEHTVDSQADRIMELVASLGEMENARAPRPELLKERQPPVR